MLLMLLGTLLATYVGWTFICLEANVRQAKAIGVPVIRQPIDSFNILWLTVQNLVWAVLDRLPIAWSSYPSWVRCLRRSWQFVNKNHWNLEHGPVFAFASPVCITLYFADADVACEIYQRRDDFIRPVQEYKILEIFGPCLSTAGWDDWPRHRKPLAKPFNEGIMKFVWSESVRQTGLMADSWLGKGAADKGVPSTTKDARTFSLNVLAGTGFNQSYDFHGSADGAVVNKGKSYRDALATVLDNGILLMLVPLPRLKAWWTPKSWGEIAKGAESFMGYMEQMVDDERQAQRESKQNNTGIMKSFIHALDDYESHQKTKDPSLPDIPKNRRGLSLDELYSNLFIINFAGHDTTANTIAFAIFNLAAYPAVQEWVSEEIEAVVGDLEPEEWQYHGIFPKLNRCRAVFWESLRLFPPVMAIPKWTANKHQQLSVQGQVLSLPAETRTYIYPMALHTMPQYWEDPLTWKPSRWVIKSAEGGLANETFLEPRPGTFLPWSGGAQNCPGKKFADVEAAALVLRLLHRHHVKIKLEPGESEESGFSRAKACMDDVDCSLVLRMVDPLHTKLIYEPCVRN